MEVLNVVLEGPRHLNKADLVYHKHVPGKDGGSERFTVGNKGFSVSISGPGFLATSIHTVMSNAGSKSGAAKHMSPCFDQASNPERRRIDFSASRLLSMEVISWNGIGQ